MCNQITNVGEEYSATKMLFKGTYITMPLNVGQ